MVAWQNPYDSVTVVNELYGSRVEYRWGGIGTVVTNVGNKEVDPKKLTAFWFMFGALLFVTMVAVALFTDVPIYFAVFFGALGIFVSVNAMGYALNRTVFEIGNGELKVRTRPVPIRRSRTLPLADIDSIKAFHGVSRMATKGGVAESPYTTVSATYANGPPVLLLKVEGYKADLDFLAGAVNDSIDRYRKTVAR